MIKRILMLIFTLGVFLIFTSDVFAAQGDLVYDASLYLSEEYLTFEGWAEFNAYNNLGGSSTIIKIYAHKRGDNNVSNWLQADLNYNGDYNRSLYEANCIRGSNKLCLDPYVGGKHDCIPGKLDSGCLYENVGFTAKFKLKDLFDKFNTSDITFTIEVYNSNANKTKKTSLAVFEGSSNMEEGTFNGSKFNVKLSSLAKEGKMVVDYGRVLSGTNGNKAHGGSFYWQLNANYDIVKRDISNNAEISNLTMYALKYVSNNGRDCNNNEKYTGLGIPGNSCIGWAYATWVQATGSITINLEYNEEPLVCEVNVNKELMCENGTFDSECKETINAKTIVMAGEGGCGGGTATVKANVVIKQKGSLEFSLDRGPIYAGGGFQYSLVYNNEITWDYAENGKKECPNVVIEYWDSGQKECKQKIVKSSECDSDSEYDAIIKKAMASKYNGLKNSSAVVSMPDSNNVKAPTDNDTGTWSCTADNVTSWAPNTTLKASCKFTLYNAFIDKQTSNVVYGNYEGDKYIAKGSMYFTPIKYPSGQFPVKATFSGLSSINSMKWNATYECGIECQQKLIEDKYLYYFRPISLSEPFPNNRTPGSNWIDWIKDEENKKRLLNTYTTSNNLEYTVNLTNTDIANIKKYNEGKNFEGKGYLDNSIDINGNSDFIKKYNYFTLGNVNHSGLGVFDPGDDTQ